jgi:hypothetical protein
VLLAMSTAVESARSASAEPSVASSILVGKMLILNLLFPSILHSGRRGQKDGGSKDSVWTLVAVHAGVE